MTDHIIYALLARSFTISVLLLNYLTLSEVSLNKKFSIN